MQTLSCLIATENEAHSNLHDISLTMNWKKKKKEPKDNNKNACQHNCPIFNWEKYQLILEADAQNGHITKLSLWRDEQIVIRDKE